MSPVPIRTLFYGVVILTDSLYVTICLCLTMLVLDFVFGREYTVVLCLNFGFLLLHPSYSLLFRTWILFYGLVQKLLVAVLQNYLFCFLRMLYGNINSVYAVMSFIYFIS
jgi:hypothetical protein